MALESVTHISDLVQTNPTSTDPASQGDDHIRNIKKALKNTFAFITGAVTASHTELNFVKGVTSSIQTQLNNLGTLIADEIASVNSAIASVVGRSIIAGNGLTGGGALDQSRTLTLGTPGSITGSSTNSVTATSHTHLLDLGSLPFRTGGAINSDTSPRLIYINGSNNGTISRVGAEDVHNVFSITPQGRSITAGNGLTGGGDLTNNRSIALGTPGGLSATSTNTVTATSHTHEIDSSIARSARTITAGDGLTGGGDLTADRSFAVDGTVVRTSRNITAGNGLTGGGNLGANRTLSLGTPGGLSATSTNSVTDTSHTHEIDDSIARSARTIAAGNGLTGGGDLTANRSLALGTPSSITATSTNSVTGTSHTHALSEASVRSLISNGAADAVGTYALVRANNGTTRVEPGDNIAGSSLYFANAGGTNSGTSGVPTPTGTWKIMGFVSPDGSDWSKKTTLALRVA